MKKTFGQTQTSLKHATGKKKKKEKRKEKRKKKVLHESSLNKFYKEYLRQARIKGQLRGSNWAP